MSILLGRISGVKRRKPGFAGLRYRFGPACGVAAAHPSNPLRGWITAWNLRNKFKKQIRLAIESKDKDNVVYFRNWRGIL
jgi:hypothetical protein